MGARLPGSTDRNTAAITTLDLPRKPERRFPPAPRLYLVVVVPSARKTSRCAVARFLLDVIFVDVTVHFSIFGTCALREPPHQDDDNSITENC